MYIYLCGCGAMGLCVKGGEGSVCPPHTFSYTANIDLIETVDAVNKTRLIYSDSIPLIGGKKEPRCFHWLSAT